MNNIKHAFQTEDNLNTFQFLPENANRQCEGGLRTKGKFKQGTCDNPLISIITVVFNGEKFLEQTILSVLNQTYDNVEYIIIDGGSTDKTLSIIKKYQGLIDYWISEPDDGISDAFNKGVSCANGDYINFQGDGDGFYQLDSIEKLVARIKRPLPKLVSARICRLSEADAPLFISKQSRYFSKLSLLFRMSLPHQGLFVHKTFFTEYGVFDVNNTFCMDYEHLLRAYRAFPEVQLIDIVVANWRDDGLGNGRILEIFKEYDLIKRKNKIAPLFILDLINGWTHLKYCLKRCLSFITNK